MAEFVDPFADAQQAGNIVDPFEVSDGDTAVDPFQPAQTEMPPAKGFGIEDAIDLYAKASPILPTREDLNRLKMIPSALSAAKNQAIGSIGQFPRFMQESQRSASEDVPSMQMEFLEGLGVDIPEPLKMAHQKYVETSVKAVNPFSGMVEALNTAETIPALKGLMDEQERFAVEQIKKSDAIRQTAIEDRGTIGKMIKEGRLSDVSEYISDLAIMEAPQLAIQAIVAYFSRGASLGYMGGSAASSKYAQLGEEDVTPIQRVANSLGTGIAEGFFERLGTGRVLDKMFSGKVGAVASNKIKEIAIDAMGGSASEGLTSLGENALDMMVGLDANLGDGVAESLILGFMFDGGMSISSQISTARRTDKYRKGLIAAGATEQEADDIISRASKASNKAEWRKVDEKIGEIIKRNKPATENDAKIEVLAARAEQLLRQKELSDEERKELVDITQNIDAVRSSEIETKMLRRDIHNLSKENPFAIHPKDINRNTSEAELKETIDALEEMYGYRPTKKQIIDAFLDPMQKVEIETDAQKAKNRERKLNELDEMIGKFNRGEVSGEDLLAVMEEIDAQMVSEFNERTTGDNQERPREVLKDLSKKYKAQEVQNDSIERAETDGAEQGEVTGREQERTQQAEQEPSVQEPSATETGEVEAPKQELTPISQVKDTPVADPKKDVFPPNPQVRFSQWYREMMDFAVKEVQSGTPMSEFISDMEADYLHYEATSETLRDIYHDAKIEAKRVADEIAKAEKVSAKAKITQKQFKDTETETVKSSTLIRELFRVQQRASKEGRKAGIAEIREKIKSMKAGASDLVGEFRNQMEDLRGATKLEKANLRLAIKDIQLAKTPESQVKAFERAVDMLESTFEAINERTPRYEYVPFPEAETETGVDRNSSYKEVRAKFLEYGGDPTVRKNGDMLNFLNGTETQAAGRFIEPERKSMIERDKRVQKSPLLRNITKLHEGKLKGFMGAGRYNMFDFLGHISRGNPDSNLSKMRIRLAEGEVDAGSNRKILEEKAREINPKGKHTTKVMNTNVTIDTPVGKRKISLGEIIMLDMALDNKENAEALANNDIIFDSGGKRTFRASEAELRAMVDQAMNQMSSDARTAYEQSKVLYEEIVNISGDMIEPTANLVMKDLGLDQTFKKVDGKYVPIILSDISKGEAIEIEVPDGAGGVEIQKVADNYINREIHKGKYKERTGGAKGGRIRVGNIDSVLSHIMDTSAEFAAKGVMQNDLLKLLNNKALKTQINRTFGSDFADLLMEKAYQTTGTMQTLKRTPLDRGLSRAFSFVDPYRLSRPSTGLIMASSAQMVRPFLKNKEAFGLGLKHGTNSFIQNKIQEDGFTYSRYSGRAFSPELAEQGAKIKTRSGGGTGETRASNLISWGDKGAISTVYTATAFDEMISRGTGKTMEDLKKQDDDFWRAVSVRVAYETMRTQPSGTSAAVSVWKGRARNNIIWRLLTRYGSQGSRIYNNVIDAVDEYAYNPNEENRSQLHRVLESQVITNTAILSGIKATRLPIKRAILVFLLASMGREDEAEEMKEKRDEAVDKMFTSFVANFARTQLRTIEGIDDLTTLYDFFDKKYVDDPFSGIMTSELRDMKDVVQAYKTATKWDRILASGEKETTVNGRKVMKPITASQRDQYTKNYENAVARMVNKSRGLALIMSRLPLAGLEDVAVGDDIIAEKFVKWKTDK